jgi:hypothetical protein
MDGNNHQPTPHPEAWAPEPPLRWRPHQCARMTRTPAGPRRLAYDGFVRCAGLPITWIGQRLANSQGLWSWASQGYRPQLREGRTLAEGTQARLISRRFHAIPHRFDHTLALDHHTNGRRGLTQPVRHAHDTKAQVRPGSSPETSARIDISPKNGGLRPPRCSSVPAVPAEPRAPTASLSRSASLTLDTAVPSRGSAATRRMGANQGLVRMHGLPPQVVIARDRRVIRDL